MALGEVNSLLGSPGVVLNWNFLARLWLPLWEGNKSPGSEGMKWFPYPNYNLPKVRILLKKIKISGQKFENLESGCSKAENAGDTVNPSLHSRPWPKNFPTVPVIEEGKEFHIFLSVILASGTDCLAYFSCRLWHCPVFWKVVCVTTSTLGRKCVHSWDQRSCPCEPWGSCMDQMRAKPVDGWCLLRLALCSHMNGPPNMSLPHCVFDNCFSVIVVGYLFWVGPFYNDICPTKVVNKEFITDEKRLLKSTVEYCLKMYLQQFNICASLQVKVKGYGFLTKFITTIYIVLWFHMFFYGWKWARVSCWPLVALLREQPVPIC